MRLGHAVECERISVRYGEFVAVDDVTFDVKVGEVFGLLGPNGAGKTSVVRVLSTIVDPASGDVHISGVPLSSPNRIRDLIGVLPESNGYPETVTAVDYLVYFGRLYGLDVETAKQRAKELLSEVGLDEVAGKHIGTFSRGMRQRLGIARALVNRPSVLILDEPTLGLDPAGREDVLSSLTMLAAESGVSVILCSHLLDDVERVCDRIAILDNGKIVASGSVMDVIQNANVAHEVTVSVSPPLREMAISLLSEHPDIQALAAYDLDPHVIELQLFDHVSDINGVLQALTNAEIPIYEVRRRVPSLSDAFLALTSSVGTNL